MDKWDGNLFAISSSTNACNLFKFFTKFKIKVAEFHAQRHTDIANIYKKKIASMNKILIEVNDPPTIEANTKQLITLLDEAEMYLSKFRYLRITTPPFFS